MARKLPALQRILGPEAIASIIYGEVSSSLYFSLGVVALWALGLTPFVLLGAGLLFGLAAGAYAEGSTAVDAPGGSSAIARRAFGDLVGFVVGWAVLLDFIVVIALSLLFVPHYALAAGGRLGDLHHPDDEIIAGALAVIIAAFRLLRRARLYAASWIVAALDLAVQLTLAVLGLALVFDGSLLGRTLHLGSAPSWTAVAYAVPLAMVAFAGIEVVANLLREAKEPGTALARETLSAVVVTIVLYAIIAAVGMSAFPPHAVAGTPSGYASDLSLRWINAPLAGIADAIGHQLGSGGAVALRGVVGASATLVLLLNATTAFSGASRLLRSLGEAGALPAAFAQTRRRSLASPAGVGLIAAGVCGILPIASLFDREVTGLVSIYAFGILLAFMAVFLAVVWLRFTEPDLPRPLRMRLNVRWGRVQVPVLALLGFGLAWAAWVLVLGTHRAGRIVAPAWLLCGLVVFLVVRRGSGVGVLSRYEATAPPPPELTEIPYGTIVVPMKQAGPIEEEMLATACKLAQAQGARVLALKIIEVPLALPLDVDLPAEQEAAERSMALAASFGPDYGVEVEGRVVRGRAISSTLIKVAREEGAGLILIGAVPRVGAIAGRAQVFSETVENLLRRADCRVIVTAFPPGTASVAEPEEDAQAAAQDGAPAERPAPAPH